MAKILIVDDEIGIRELLSEILDEEGYTVYAAENAEAARVLMSQEQFDLILLDIWMPDTDGITLLKEWGVRKMLNCPVIMMSGHGTIETAVEATKFGALAFLEKPISMQKLLDSVRHGLDEGLERRGATAVDGAGESSRVTGSGTGGSLGATAASKAEASHGGDAAGKAEERTTRARSVQHE